MQTKPLRKINVRGRRRVCALAGAVNPPRLTFSRGSKRCDLEYDGTVMNSKCDVTTDHGNCGLNDNCQRLDELEQNRVQALEAQNAQLMQQVAPRHFGLSCTQARQAGMKRPRRSTTGT